MATKAKALLNSLRPHFAWRILNSRSICSCNLGFNSHTDPSPSSLPTKIDFNAGSETEVGGVYKGIVTSIKEYGAYVEFNGGQQGLLDISELSHDRVSQVSDVVSVGQQLSLMCLGMDVCGNIKLSLRATLPQAKMKESFVDDSPRTPAKTSPYIWASVHDRFHSQAKQGRNEGQLVNKDEVDEGKFSTASITFLETRSVASWTKTIHKLCTVDRNVDEALQLLDSLRLRGYRPNSLNLSSVIHALCRAHRYAEAHQRLLFFIASQCIPEERTCNVLIARLLDSETPHATYNLICRLINLIPQFVPSLTNYNRLIHQFCKSLEPNVAHRVFLDMMDRGHCPNVVSYTTLINGYCKCGEFGIARKLFNKMSEMGVVPNSLTISVLLGGVLRSRDTQCAKELMNQLWEKMRHDYDSSVNCAAFANVMDSLCGEGFCNEVFQIAEDLPQGTSVSEEFAYAQMIDSLCRVGRYHGASRIVYIMRRRGVTPSLLSYNSIIHGLTVEGGCMRAFQLFQEGIQFGYVPSEYTYRILVESLCQEGDVPKAKEILQFFIQQKAVDRTRLYNIYIGALCLVNNATELLNTLVLMLQMQCKPDVITLNTVINGFCKMRRIDDAMKVFNDMIMGEFCPPDCVTFTTVLGGLLDAGKTEEALVLLQEKMPERGLIPSVVTYNAVLRGLFKLKKTDEAMEIYRTMVTHGVIADSTTYTIIIDGLFDADRVGDAKRFWDETIWPSNVHDNFVYASILKGLIHSGRLGEACDFLYELVDCRVSPNIINYNILVDGACKLGLKKQAYQIVGEMRKNGLSPDAITWRILEKLHRNVSTHQTSIGGKEIYAKIKQ